MEPCSVNVLLTKEHVILTKGSNSLWCARDDGQLLPGKEPDYAHLDSPTDLGKVWGCIGKIRFFTDGEWKLLLISQASSVGILPHGGEVYCVERIAIVPLTMDSNPEIIGLEVPSELVGEGGSAAGNPTLGVKIMKNLAGGGKDRERPREKVEKRLTEALLWMFNDSRSFYFSMDTDLTKPLQRQLSGEQPDPQDTPYWKRVDDRFFWNRWMISDLLDDNYVGSFADHWIIPLIQGYVEICEVPVLTGQTSDVSQGRYHHHQGRLKKKDSDVDLKTKATGGGGGSEAGSGAEGRAMIEMTEMTGKADVEQEEDDEEDLKELELAALAAKEDEGVGSGYESDSESAVSCCTDDMLNDYLGNVYGESSDLEREVDRGSDSAAADSLGSPKVNGREEEGVSQCLDTEEAELVGGSEQEALVEVPSLSGTEQGEFREGQHQQENGQGDVALPGSTQPLPIVSLTPAGGSDAEVARERLMLTESNEQDQFHGVDSPSGSPNNSLDLLSLDQVADQRSGSESSDREDSILSRSRWRNSFLSISPMSEFSLRQKRWVGERKEAGDDGVTTEKRGEEVPTFTLAIVSRRSRHRAGTRYKRRGVDVEGHVANYVETEMLVECGIHVVSYILVRGSVPIYWTQPGYKYRPPPVIEKGEQETQEAFKKHFESQLQLYKELALVNLVKQTGREKTIAEAYEEHTLLLDSPCLTYIAFDFHQHYKNNQAAAIRLLLRESARLVKKFKFFWLDSHTSSSPLCQQEGVFRVNCMDCLDRTNVIESVFAREVLQTVLQKLGVISFEDKLSGPTLLSYQEMWGNNGDIISRQYAGTAAMKGDITRYGERKISGLMKDGYNSAHRYYLNVFRDTYRQVLIDLMQGESPADAFTSLPASMRGADEAVDEVLTLDPLVPVPSVKRAPKERLWSLDKEQDVTDMIQKCRGELYPNPRLHVQCWAMMEAAGYSFLESSQREELCVLMQCREHADLCIASYNSEMDKVVCFIRIPMDKIEKISIGTLGMILRSSKRLYMRIVYSLVDDMQRYFTLKTINFTSMDEDKSILQSIATALEFVQPTIILHEQRLNKKKSLPHPGVIHLVELDNVLNMDKESDVKMVQSPNQQLDKVDEEQEEDEEEEPSNSVPSSPKLSVRSPLSHALSHSFDDLISNVNNEIVSSPTLVASPKSPLRQILPKQVNFHPLESGESGSDSEIEMTEFSTVGKKKRSRVSATNPLSDHNSLGETIDHNQSESDTEKSDNERNNKSRRASESSTGGKFAQLKGKLLQTVNSLKPPMSALRLRPSTSRAQQNGDSDSSASQSQSQSSGKFMSVRRRHFSSSPDTSRRIRQRSPQNEPSEEELQRQKAMENSKTTFLILKAV